MFQMCGVFAEFERMMIRERVRAGLARARARARPSDDRAYQKSLRIVFAQHAAKVRVSKRSPQNSASVSVPFSAWYTVRHPEPLAETLIQSRLLKFTRILIRPLLGRFQHYE
ncbi:MAG: recombinase family protein [Candidatus Competibacteraceae bacterium]